MFRELETDNPQSPRRNCRLAGQNGEKSGTGREFTASEGSLGLGLGTKKFPSVMWELSIKGKQEHTSKAMVRILQVQRNQAPVLAGFV